MRLEDITHVFCLSCVLMIFCVSSQPSCNLSWFGHLCKYKCRCENASCNDDGSCIQPYNCQGGWFGPACQYVDIAYGKGNVTELTDGNDQTCNAPNAGDSITISFDDPHEFTWLRIHVKDQGSDALTDLTVSFNSSGDSVPCPVWKQYAMNKTVLDMHCDLSQSMTDVTLTGQAVPHLCSVYVSGGRNVAVKETAWQHASYTNTYAGESQVLDASRAVDGDTTPDVDLWSCSHTELMGIWSVTLSTARNIHGYAIYNKARTYRYLLMGFTLESFDSLNNSVFKYKDKEPTFLAVYKIRHSPLPIQKIVITAANINGALILCEVEVFGDSICDEEHYGRDCEHSCNCADNEACFVTTGACPSGCPPGFFGDACMGTCPAGKLGNYCNLTCSPNCDSLQNGNTSACDNNAVCRSQCLVGFTGSSCDEKCDVGKFGMNCTESCSSKCDTPSQANMSPCDTKTGACLSGCHSGFSGAMCADVAPSTNVASTSSSFELIGLCSLLAVALLAAFCMKRKGKTPQVAEGATSVARDE